MAVSSVCEQKSKRLGVEISWSALVRKHCIAPDEEVISAECVCEWENVASIVECFEWSVYWKSAVEVHFQTDRDSLLNS